MNRPILTIERPRDPGKKSIVMELTAREMAARGLRVYIPDKSGWLNADGTIKPIKKSKPKIWLNEAAGLFLLMVLSLPASAQQYVRDPSTGNTYQVYHSDITGNTTIFGNNQSNGTRWSQTVERDGDQRGINAQGQMWQYQQQRRRSH